MDMIKIAPDNNRTSELDKSEIVGRFFLKQDEQFTKIIEKRVSDLKNPPTGTEVRITFQLFLFLAVGPDVRRIIMSRTFFWLLVYLAPKHKFCGCSSSGSGLRSII